MIIFFYALLKKGIQKKQITFILLLLYTLPVTAQWAKNIGGSEPEFGQVITVDEGDNVYVTGNFAGTTDFDPGPGVFNLQSSCDESNPPKSDIFLAKYDLNGNFLWAVGIGGSEADLAEGIGLDANANVYITGLFWGTADFDPGSTTHNLTSAGSSDIFLAKFDTNGNLLWANNFGGILNDGGYGLSVDDLGNAFVTGSFLGIADFDPGAGTVSYNSNNTTDVFFAKYNPDGSLAWAKDIAGSGEQNGHNIDIDQTGNIYVSGEFFGTTDFDPGPGVTSLSGAGSKDSFFAKYDANGNLIWAKSIGAIFDEEAVNITVDASGNLYATGYFVGTTDFDPGPGSYVLTSAAGGLFDGFLLKLDANGIFQWAFDIGNTGADVGLSVCVDNIGNPYITGAFQGTVDFDPGPGIYNLTGGGNEMYFAKYNSNGDFVWAQKEGSSFDEAGASIFVDQIGLVYITGYFTGITSFQTGAGSTLLSSAGKEDVILLKFRPSTVLPVNFLSFTGKKINDHIVLNWAVASEVNNTGYEIERSTNSTLQNNWKTIGFINARNQNGSNNSYEFKDPALLNGTILYRLKQIDHDGHFNYSSIVTIKAGATDKYVLHQNIPNPVQGTTRISYSLPERSSIKMYLYNDLGEKIMLLENSIKAAGSYEINVNCSHLQSGTYYYSLQAREFNIIKKMIIVSH